MQRVPARLVEADGLAHQLAQRLHLGVRTRGADRLAGLVDLIDVVDHHRRREPAHAAGRLLNVRDRPVDLIVACRLLTAAARHRGIALRRLLLADHTTGRRLIGQGARNAAGERIGADALFLVQLLGADRGLVRIIGLLGALDTREIQVGRHLDPHPVAPDDGHQQRLNAIDIARLDPMGIFEMVQTEPAALVLAIRGQQAPALIDHGHAIRGELRHAGRHQMHDGPDLGVGQAPAALQMHDDRGARRHALAHEHRALGLGDVHARLVDRLQGGDGAPQFALERALEAGALDQTAGAEAGLLLQQFEADVGRLRQPLTGQLQPGLGDALLRNLDAPGTVVDPVGHAELSQGFHHLGGFGPLELAEQRHIGWLECPEQDGHHRHQSAGQGAEQRDLAPDRHLPEALETERQATAQRIRIGGRGLILIRILGDGGIDGGHVRLTRRRSGLDLHAHDFLIGRQQPVAHLVGGLESDARPVHGHHDLGQTDIVVPQLEACLHG